MGWKMHVGRSGYLNCAGIEFPPYTHRKSIASLKKSNLGGIDMFYLGVYSLGIFMLALIGMVTNKDVSRNMRFYGSLVFVPGVVYVLLTVISRSW